MLNETRVALRGNVATEPVLKVTANGTTVSSFRLAVTARQWSSGENRMIDAETSFYTVTCWRTLAENVVGSLEKGHSVLVQGRLRVRDYTHEGQSRTSADVTADVVGVDLSWGTTEFLPNRRSRPEDGRDDGDRSEADELATQVTIGALDEPGGAEPAGSGVTGADEDEIGFVARQAEPAF